MADSAPPELANTLRSLRERKGLSRAALADKVGAHHNQIQKLENGERKLTVEWIARLAPHLGTSTTAFLAEAHGEPKPEKKPESVKVPETVPAPSNVYTPEKWPLDLPVMGIGECGPEGWSLWNGEIVQMAPRPPSLAGVPKAYAVYANGSSMEPRYYAGEIVFIHPAKPVEIGDFVLVQMQPAGEGETPRALLKRLVRRSGGKVVVEQFNPAKRIELKASEILSMHKVVGSGSA